MATCPAAHKHAGPPTSLVAAHALDLVGLALLQLLHPHATSGVSVSLQRGRQHGDAVARGLGGHVVAVLADDGVHKVLVQVVHPLQHAVIALGADVDVVDQRQVLHVLAQTHTTGVRAHALAILGGHEVHRHDLIHTRQTAAIDLHKVDSVAHDELLEDDAVLAVLASGHADTIGLQCLAHRLVAQDIIGAGGLLDPPRLEGRQVLHPLNGLSHLPAHSAKTLQRVKIQARVAQTKSRRKSLTTSGWRPPSGSGQGPAPHA